MSEEELQAQWKIHDFIYLQKNSIDYALKKGREEGANQTQKDIALNLYREAKMSHHNIAKILEVDLEVVEEILKERTQGLGLHS